MRIVEALEGKISPDSNKDEFTKLVEYTNENIKKTNGINFSIVNNNKTKKQNFEENIPACKPHHRKEFSNIDDLMNYIQNDQPKKKPAKKSKKNKQKLDSSKKETSNNKDNELEDEKLLESFRKNLKLISVNAHLFPKIKPNLTPDWVKSLEYNSNTKFVG